MKSVRTYTCGALGLFLFFLSLSYPLFSQHERVVEIDSIPRTLGDFLELRKELINTPEGTCALFLLGLKIFIDDKVTGNECLISVSDRSILIKSVEKYTYNGYKFPRNTLALIQKQLKKYPYLPDSYFPDTKASEKYRVGKGPYEFVFYKRLYSGSEYSGKLKYFIPTNGSSKQRPLSITRNEEGHWLVSEFEAILASVRPPSQKESEEASEKP